MGSEQQGGESVVLHLEDFEDIGDLKDAEAGKLLKAILFYTSTGELSVKLGIQSKTMFGYIRRHIDRDKAKYAETCRKRAEAGKKGGRPGKNDGNHMIPPESKEKQKKQMVSDGEPPTDAPEDALEAGNPDEKNQNKAKEANGFFEKQNNPDPDPEPDPDPDPEPDPDPDPEPVAQTVGAKGRDLDSEKASCAQKTESRIRYLETMCRLYRSGALTDRADYERHQAELSRLKGDGDPWRPPGEAGT